MHIKMEKGLTMGGGNMVCLFFIAPPPHSSVFLLEMLPEVFCYLPKDYVLQLLSLVAKKNWFDPSNSVKITGT
jgi:hypothetical protein